jgi:hypothetical protein
MTLITLMVEFGTHTGRSEQSQATWFGDTSLFGALDDGWWSRKSGVADASGAPKAVDRSQGP